MPSPWLQRELRALNAGVKKPLAEAAGKYLHARQDAPLSPFAIQRGGIRYQDVSPDAFAKGQFWLSTKREAAWGSGSYAIAPDGKLTVAHFNYDSSG